MNQGILNKTLRKFFQTWSQMKENDKILVGVWSRMLADGVPHFWFTYKKYKKRFLNMKNLRSSRPQLSLPI